MFVCIAVICIMYCDGDSHFYPAYFTCWNSNISNPCSPFFRMLGNGSYKTAGGFSKNSQMASSSDTTIRVGVCVCVFVRVYGPVPQAWK